MIIDGLIQKDIIHLTFSNRVKAFKYLDEISRRDKLTAKKILNLPAIKAIFTNQNLDRSQKGDKLINQLYALRYPEITRCEEKFKQAGKLKSTHSPYFEGSDMSFQMKPGGDYELRIIQPEK